MKLLNKRTFVVLFLSFVFSLSVLAFAGTVKPVKAKETTSITLEDFTLEESASVRIGANATVTGSGIRFRASLSNGLYETLHNAVTENPENPSVYMGFIITPKYYYDEFVR